MHRTTNFPLAISDVFSDDRFVEMLLWGIGFVFVLIGMFIVARLLKYQIGNKVKESPLPFGMSASDLEKIQKDGQLTDEEIKAVRRTMARKIVARAMEEEKARKGPSSAAAAIAAVEEKLRTQGVEGLRREEEQVATGVPAPIARKTDRQLPQEPAEPKLASLPEHLKVLLYKSEFELEELLSAGFITPEQLVLLRIEREKL